MQSEGNREYNIKKNQGGSLDDSGDKDKDERMKGKKERKQRTKVKKKLTKKKARNMSNEMKLTLIIFIKRH